MPSNRIFYDAFVKRYFGPPTPRYLPQGMLIHHLKACDNVSSDYKQHFFDQSNSLASELVKCAANKLPLVQVQSFMEKHFRIEFRYTASDVMNI